MEARVKLFGHPLHQMLVVLPLGLLTGVILFDVVHLITDGSQWALISYWLIRGVESNAPGMIALALSFARGALSVLTGWLGGELVDRLGIGVDDGAHMDAPSSLSGLPAGHSASRTHAA